MAHYFYKDALKLLKFFVSQKKIFWSNVVCTLFISSNPDKFPFSVFKIQVFQKNILKSFKNIVTK